MGDMNSPDSSNIQPPQGANAALIFADGLVVYGRGHGAYGTAFGEVCFNTSTTGYQETISDPSYYKQIITFTFPHIGNVGTNAHDMESARAYASGIIIREPITQSANYRSEANLQQWLVKQGVVAISGVDTRALTQYIRSKGSQNVLIYYPENGLAGFNLAELQQHLNNQPAMDGLELAAEVACTASYNWSEPLLDLELTESQTPTQLGHIVLIDYGVKYAILRCLYSAGAKVTVLPATSSLESVLALKPDGVCLSNGPGDPARTYEYTGALIQGLLGKQVPILGICLGYQLLALAQGAKTRKMRQGHRGCNHPVQNRENKRVEITSQNHGFEVVEVSLNAAAIATRSSLFDGSLEGIDAKNGQFLSVQYHPESSPGPNDSRYIFSEFMQMVANSKQQEAHA